MTNAIKKADIDALLKAENGLCISIYVPTHRAGAQVLEGGDQTLFKNRLRDARTQLAENHKLTEREIQELTKPADDLLGDANFWRHQTEGLAVFITKGFSKHFNLPMAVEEKAYVLDHFYALPLMPAFNYNNRFLLLALDRNHVELYEATNTQIRPLNAGKLFPESMNEALKFDIKGNDQDFHHSTTTVNGSNIVHGAGASKGDEEHERVREWMLAIEHGLDKILHNEHVPLVLAGVEHVCGIFRNVTKYKHVVEGHVPIDNNRQNPNEMLQHALPLVDSVFKKPQIELKAKFNEVQGQGFGSDDVATVAAEAIHGRVDALFVKPGQPVWGRYNPDSASVEIHDNYQPGDADLVNLAAIKTLSQSGRVFVDEHRANSNGQAAQVAALFRY